MAEQPSNFNEFDAAVVGQALGAEPRTMRDIAHGDGEALDVGDTVLEVYRDAGFARVTTPDARSELFRVPRYSVSGERVVFEQGEQEHRSRLQVKADGKVAFHSHLRAPESSTTGETAPAGRQDSPTPTTPSENGTARHNAGAAEKEKGGEVAQLQLQGRLGRDPWYNTQGDQPIAGFPLTVNDEQGKATWHRVVVFGEVADQVHQAHGTGHIRKGRPVQVTGAQVTRDEETARGGTRKVVEFHASAVSRLTPTKTRP
jgi:hypothetical protein